MRAVILAGGLGSRLRPYTTSLPKPLMPIAGELPILEIILRQLRRDGFERVTLAVGYLSGIIEAFFGDGSRWGLEIDYSLEDKPLSTIGPLTLIDDLPDTFLVMNGDILTDVDYGALMRYHQEQAADVTVAVSRRTVKVDYGVLHREERVIDGFTEKPEYHFEVSMGIYVVNRTMVEGLTRNEPYGFDNLMVDGIAKGSRLVAYPFEGYWLDIGRPDDYDRANEEFASMRQHILDGGG